MKKVATIEIYADERMDDAAECVKEVIQEASGHYYVLDGTVEVKVIELAESI